MGGEIGLDLLDGGDALAGEGAVAGGAVAGGRRVDGVAPEARPGFESTVGRGDGDAVVAEDLAVDVKAGEVGDPGVAEEVRGDPFGDVGPARYFFKIWFPDTPPQTMGLKETSVR